MFIYKCSIDTNFILQVFFVQFILLSFPEVNSCSCERIYLHLKVKHWSYFHFLFMLVKGVYHKILIFISQPFLGPVANRLQYLRTLFRF